MKLTPAKTAHLPGNIALGNDEVHIWQIATAIDSQRIIALQRLLAPTELQRAHQFLFEKDQHRFIIARGTLRHIISVYLDLAPTQISFAQNPYGKPYLINQYAKLEFNVSHSHELILIAITKTHPVGIDLEFIRDDINPEAIASRFFSEQELSLLCRLPPAEKKMAFFQLWSKKEATVKMLGTGLYQALDKIDVSSHNPERFLYELFPSPDYAGALCTSTSASHIQYLSLEL